MVLDYSVLIQTTKVIQNWGQILETGVPVQLWVYADTKYWK
jgi:hypothetical protein